MHCSWEALRCAAKERLVVGDVSWPVHCTDLGVYHHLFCDQILSQRELLGLLQAGVCVHVCSVDTERTMQ